MKTTIKRKGVTITKAQRPARAARTKTNDNITVYLATEPQDAPKSLANIARTRMKKLIKSKDAAETKVQRTARTSRAARTKTSAYDVAEHLRTPKEIATYLAAWLQDAPDDVAGIARALGDSARAKGMSNVAKSAGLSRESLYKALSSDGNPSFSTVLKVVRALGVRLQFEAA